MRNISRYAAAAALILLNSLLIARVQAAEREIAVVVKIGGIPWFTAMEKGIKEAGKEQGVKAYMSDPPSGPRSASARGRGSYRQESQCDRRRAQ